MNIGFILYPYLLRDVKIASVNQVWSTDITYLPVLKGHFYLAAVMDWYSRKVLSLQVSNTMDGTFCVAVLEATLSRYHKPTIFNSDQGRSVHGKRLHANAQAVVGANLDGRTRTLL